MSLIGAIQTYKPEVINGNRTITCDANDRVYSLGATGEAGAKRMDVKVYGATSAAYVNHDASANTQYYVGITLVVGHTASVTVSDGDGATNLIPRQQFLGATKAAASMLIGSFNTTNDATVAPSLNFLKSGHGTVGSNTVVADTEILGEITFFGADATDFESPAARIHAYVNGTPGTGDMPGALAFSTTPDGSETLAIRLTIAQSGAVTIAAPTTPAAIGTTPGTAAPTVFTMTGGIGGGTSIATTGVGGVGGGLSITLGAGGVATAAVTAATGGAGGAWAITTGAGGAEAVAGVDATGGAGGAVTYTTGAGGAVSAAVSGTATGGASGAVTVQSGTGGAVTATTGTNVGGASGAMIFRSGSGGAASGATDTGGASGAVTIASGSGGNGDTGGVSGDVTIQTGAVGTGGAPTAGSVLLKTAATTRYTISGVGLHTIAASATPTSVSSTPGTAAGEILTATGGLGGATTNASGVGGIGGGVAVTLGAGGASSGATAPTGGAGGAWTLTTGAGAACTVAASGNSIGGAGGAVSYTTGAGGAVSGAVAGTATGGASGGLTWTTGTGGAVTATTGTNVGGASGAVSLTTGSGGAASGATDTGGASGAITITTGTGGNGDTGGVSGALNLGTGAVGTGGSPVVGIIAFKPGTNEKWRIDGTGNLTSVAGVPANVTADGAIIATGGISATDVLNAWIDDATHGDGTTTHYIGNQTITTASDKRIKADIEDSKRDAEAIVMGLRVVDFTWNDPTDRSPTGKNERGRYMGMIAQEVEPLAPWAVNPGPARHCSKCRAGEECPDHVGNYWFMEYDYLVPPLVKAVQNLFKRLVAAEEKLATLGA